MDKKPNQFPIFFFVLFLFSAEIIFAKEAYFDLSEKEIEISTNFSGKEVIIFGLTDTNFDTIITIKGPNQNTEIQKKERIFGLWMNTKRVVYNNLPSIFFITYSSPIKEILNEEDIIKNSLNFKQSIKKIITDKNFNTTKNINYKIWDENLIKIKQNLNFYKEYKIQIMDNKLFQTRVFFPADTTPGTYDINIYQIKNKIIVSKKNKKIIVMKTGISNRIFDLAYDQPATYGIICIIFAVSAGIIGAAAFRRL